MRQFLSPRFWLTMGVLAGLALLLLAFSHRGSVTDAAEVAIGDSTNERQIDLVSWIFLAYPQPGFSIDRGVTTADLSLQLDGTRTMVIKAGTPGEIDCPGLTKPAQCTVAADLLGDAVLWFGIVPGKPGSTLVLPAVTEMMDGPWVRLANDWVVRRADRVERSCPADTSSLPDFIRTYGNTATATFNFESQRVVRVTCPGDGVVDTVLTDSGPATSVIIGTETDDTGAVTTSAPAPSTIAP